MEIAALQDFLDKKNNDARRSVRVAIKSVKKGSEKLYNNLFDPFYKWEVGVLSAHAIKDELIFFFDNQRMSDKMHKSGEKTIVAFAFLVESYNYMAAGEHPSGITNEQWLAIRKMFTTKLKGDTEQFYEGELYDNNEAEALLEENIEFDIIDNDIRDILDEIYESQWTVEIALCRHNEFNCRVGIVNCSLPGGKREEILYIVKSRLSRFFSDNYVKNSFEIKRKANDSIVAGYLLYEFL